MTNGNDAATGYGFANNEAHQEVTGLTKREYFAAMALQGLLARDSGSLNFIQADEAVKFADALIKALNQPK